MIRYHQTDEIRIAYIYCDYKDQSNQTATNLIACLIRQLIGNANRLPQQLTELYERLEKEKRRPTLEELSRLLVIVCNERSHTYVLVDALDELERLRERKFVLPLLKALPAGSTRLFVTSRPNHKDINNVFSPELQISISAPDSDIRQFVREKVERNDEFTRLITPDLEAEIIATISERASGM